MSEAARSLVPVLIVVLSGLGAGPVSADVTVSRAELDGVELRVSGRACSASDITVDGVVLGRSDASGEFRIEQDSYAAPADCTVEVGDGSGPAVSTTVSGCTASPPVADDTTEPTAPTAVEAEEGLSFLTPEAMPDARVGEAYLGSVVCSDPAGPSTFEFDLVSGEVPDGMRFRENTLEHRPEATVAGTPTRSGTFSFVVEVSDGTGAEARRTFTIVVLAG